MKSYLIQRDFPGAGKLHPAQLKQISQQSCTVLDGLGPQIQWQHSYVTGEHIWCIYQAVNEEIIREHARRGHFPINVIREIVTVISPSTAEMVV